MKRYGVILLFLGGCTFSAHGQFIDSMDTLIGNSQRMKTTIDDYFSRDPYLSKKDLLEQEDAGEHLILHYTAPGYGGTCYYHVIVDKKTRLLIGWGFDEDKGDPKECGLAG